MTSRCHRVEVRLSSEEAHDLQALSWHRGMSRSMLVRGLIQQAIKQDLEREQLVRVARPDIRY